MIKISDMDDERKNEANDEENNNEETQDNNQNVLNENQNFNQPFTQSQDEGGYQDTMSNMNSTNNNSENDSAEQNDVGDDDESGDSVGNIKDDEEEEKNEEEKAKHRLNDNNVTADDIKKISDNLKKRAEEEKKSPQDVANEINNRFGNSSNNSSNKSSKNNNNINDSEKKKSGRPKKSERRQKTREQEAQREQKKKEQNSNPGHGRRRQEEQAKAERDAKFGPGKYAGANPKNASANPSANAGTKAGAKAGTTAGTASAGAAGGAGAASAGAAGGAGAAAAVGVGFGTVLLVILIIVLIIIIIVGLFGFFTSMPGKIIGKIEDTAKSVFTNIKGTFTGDYIDVDSDEVKSLAEYLEDSGYGSTLGMGLAKVTYKEDSQSTSEGKIKEIDKFEKDKYQKNVLLAYMTAYRETYETAKRSFWGTFQLYGEQIGNLISGEGVDWKTTIEEENKAYSTGLINITDPWLEDNVSIDDQTQRIKFTQHSFWGTVMSYDLSDWTAKYGRPIELFLALHGATGMPDLTYKIATSQDFNTKVNINATYAKMTVEDLKINAGGNTYSKQDIIDAYEKEVEKEKEAKKNKKTYTKQSTLSGLNFDQIEELYKAIPDSVKVYLPYISSVKKHWYYRDIEFNAGLDATYQSAKRATQTIKYSPGDSKSSLGGFDITMNVLYEATDDKGILYQVNEPYVSGPNAAIKKLFSKKYYRYDGNIETARKIYCKKLADAGKTSGYNYTFNGQEYTLSDDEINDGTIKKEKPAFGTAHDTLAAFDIVKNSHTTAGDFVYRMLKELATSDAIDEDSRLTREALTETLKQVFVWPFSNYDSASDSVTKTNWNVKKDIDKYGIVVSDVQGETMIAPGDGEITKVDGDTITIKFNALTTTDGDNSSSVIKNPSTKTILEKYFKDDFYDVDENLPVGMTMTIKGITGATIGKITRLDKIGTAEGTVSIFLQQKDKSLTGSENETTDDDVENYMNTTYTEYKERGIIYQLENIGTAKEGTGISTEGTGSGSTSSGDVGFIMDGVTEADINDDVKLAQDSVGKAKTKVPNDGELVFHKYDTTFTIGKNAEEVNTVLAVVFSEADGKSYDDINCPLAVFSSIVNALSEPANNGKTMYQIVTHGKWSTSYTSGSYKNYLNSDGSFTQDKKNADLCMKAAQMASQGWVNHGFKNFLAASNKNTTTRDGKLDSVSERDKKNMEKHKYSASELTDYRLVYDGTVYYNGDKGNYSAPSKFPPSQSK